MGRVITTWGVTLAPLGTVLTSCRDGHLAAAILFKTGRSLGESVGCTGYGAPITAAAIISGDVLAAVVAELEAVAVDRNAEWPTVARLLSEYATMPAPERAR